jgi:hypothetical protein
MNMDWGFVDLSADRSPTVPADAAIGPARAIGMSLIAAPNLTEQRYASRLR